MAAPAFALLAATAFLAAASLRLRGLVPALLAAYLFAAAEIVGLTLVLSPFRAVAAPGYLIGEAVLAVLVAAVWYCAGRPVPRRPALDLAALPQFVAGLASLAGCYAISRRLGFSRSSSAFATLVLGSLSQVVLQATTTQNDLIVASFVVAAAVFVLDGSRRGLALAGLAVGLAVGTKTTALFALPLLAVLALATLRRRQIAALVAFATAGALCFGSFGYAENLVHRNSLLGAGSEQNAFRAGLTPASFAARLGDIFARFLDLSCFRPILHSGAGLVALLAILVAAPAAFWALDRRFG